MFYFNFFLMCFCILQCPSVYLEVCLPLLPLSSFVSCLLTLITWCVLSVHAPFLLVWLSVNIVLSSVQSLSALCRVILRVSVSHYSAGHLNISSVWINAFNIWILPLFGHLPATNTCKPCFCISDCLHLGPHLCLFCFCFVIAIVASNGQKKKKIIRTALNT